MYWKSKSSRILQDSWKIFRIQKIFRKKSQLEWVLLIKNLVTVNSICFQLVVVSKNTQTKFAELKNLQDSCKMFTICWILARIFFIDLGLLNCLIKIRLLQRCFLKHYYQNLILCLDWYLARFLQESCKF